MTTSTYVPDALGSLRDSYRLHLDATRSPKTSRIYLAALDGQIAYLADNGMPTTARAVRREHVESWMAARRATVKPATLSLEYRALVQFWKWALDEEEIDASPMAKIKPPRVPDSPVPVVTPDEMRKLLKACEGQDLNARRDTAAIRLAYDSGVRLGELVGLKVPDVDLRSRDAFVTGKGGHSRAVRFGAKTAVALDRYLRLRRGHRSADDPALWIGQDGPMSESGMAQMLARRCKAGGLPRLHWHQMRHSFADAFLADGGQEIDLQRLAGWRSPMMLRRYGASNADARARANYRSPGDRL